MEHSICISVCMSVWQYWGMILMRRQMVPWGISSQIWTGTSLSCWPDWTPTWWCWLDGHVIFQSVFGWIFLPFSDPAPSLLGLAWSKRAMLGKGGVHPAQVASVLLVNFVKKNSLNNICFLDSWHILVMNSWLYPPVKTFDIFKISK